ncbi:hypothetical protein Plhal304r1_c010g0038451 [Plasmopara halstedii]
MAVLMIPSFSMQEVDLMTILYNATTYGRYSPFGKSRTFPPEIFKQWADYVLSSSCARPKNSRQ